jgi:hypothetical protein
MQERMRLEILSLSAGFSVSPETERIELVLSGEGGNLEELQNAIDWMDAALYSSYLEENNLPRIIDRLDQAISDNRNQMRRSEESWVNSPATGYRYQGNPLIMSTGCFLTGLHHLQRLRWMLTDPGDDAGRTALDGFMAYLSESGKGLSRADLTALLGGLETTLADDAANADVPSVATLTDATRPIAAKVVSSLKSTLSDIPDANLSDDWAYLCNRTRIDLMKNPATTLAEMKGVLSLISHADNARMFMVSNSADRTATMDRIGQLVGKLDRDASDRQQYAVRDRVNKRLASRHPGLGAPLYAGLVHSGTQNGVLIFNASVADAYDTSSASILNCLSGKLYGGGGPHGLFMKTWAAGLAYSNGYGYRENSGRVSYYAERCPDVAETMRFVAHELTTAEPDSQYVNYAIAQVFGVSRAPSRYEQRGEAIAADLADGITPERVRAYREKVLAMRERKDLFADLTSRMEAAYGPVIIGYGRPLAESKDGKFFLIGPESQFQSLEEYIASTENEGDHTVYRLYPRDFWLTL